MNKIIFVATFLLHFCDIFSLQCYKCRSDNDPGCAIADIEHIPSWSYEKCDETVQSCASWIDEEITFRGCKPENPEITEILECQSDFCNFELFPSDRKHCYQCEGRRCVRIREEEHKLIPCVNYDKNDQCYTMVINKTLTYRGCLSDKNSPGIDFCLKNSTFSEFCVHSSINNQPSYDDTFACVQCDKSEPGSWYVPFLCYENQEAKKCEATLLGREPDKCFTIVGPESIERGCLKKDKNIEKCDAAKENCHICTTFNCNSKIYRGLECQKCDSRLDSECDGTKKEYVYCISDSQEENLACVLQENEINGEKNAVRGCLHTIKNENLKEKCTKNDKNCKICQTRKCNDKLTYQKCIECDSTDEPNCATLENVDKLPSVTCDEYLDQCFSKIGGKSNFGTQRGCLSQLNVSRDDDFLTICDPNNCNISPVPRSRVKCFQCDEKNDERCAFSNNNLPPLHYCRNYRGNKEECYTKMDQMTKKISRGCMSDANSPSCDDKFCQKCSFEGCNRAPKHTKPQLFCIKCTGDAKNIKDECVWGHNSTKAEQCVKQIEFGETENCFTSVSNEGIVTRGCLLDTLDEPCNDFSCKKCDFSGCNRENVIKQRCIVCDSYSDEKCILGKGLETEECPKEIQTFDERYCYTLRDGNSTEQMLEWDPL
ncbi:uncharacterized protein LOC134832732 [Culicoides brevitarsis]|uniref:uncharacterized protein LOC134832732 n=1 Tax=Culicoides brevitarsis TaxID=469753 RepID=UPI00307C9E3D